VDHVGAVCLEEDAKLLATGDTSGKVSGIAVDPSAAAAKVIALQSDRVLTTSRTYGWIVTLTIIAQRVRLTSLDALM